VILIYAIFDSEHAKHYLLSELAFWIRT